jgi:REP element-mobilizing transposase RayT
LLNEKVEKIIKDVLSGIKERYEIEINQIGFDQNHIHILLRFLPIYSGGQVTKIIKSISGRMIFEKCPEIKKELWGGEFWSDGYYIATISGKGDKKIIENYIINQGRPEDVKQLKMFEF